MSQDKKLNGMCASCMMPFKKDPKGVNREATEYCSYCFSNGKLNYAGNDVNEFKKEMIKAITDRGESKIKARIYAFMAGFAPRWKSK